MPIQKRKVKSSIKEHSYKKRLKSVTNSLPPRMREEKKHLKTNFIFTTIMQIKKITWLVICISRQIQLVRKKWTRSLILSYTNLNSRKNRKLHLLLQYAAFCFFMRLYSFFQLAEYILFSLEYDNFCYYRIQRLQFLA